ncbi:Phosphate permease PHO89 [Tetrabaena socialis]|uniref:Phosphate permease PHO89 n=1 Tax=Tetrabaena socialis TaxID=47790 RepID=A0A2J7ZSP7_9CHLO|nr:Phosphate permease PHO89 [Tetrabaena socialis]|eukprot:PNH03297.1 Phosphate permease PHO89 [Tetrabaena socialis]
MANHSEDGPCETLLAWPQCPARFLLARRHGRRIDNVSLPMQMYPNYWDDYMWLVILGAIVSFIMAAGIGANDVANAFGTSVGAKTITLRQACVIAAIFEFSGAIGLGGEVAKTIAGSIARPTAFYASPELFAYGMFVALIAASGWVFFATYLSLAVSTTHSIIGAVLGFALIWGGKGAVVWNDRMKEFPYSKGFVPVVCSWFVSPIMTGVASAIIFYFNRLIVLRRENSTTWAIYTYPILVTITVYVNIFFVIIKGAKNVAKWDQNKAGWVAGCIAAGCLLLAIFPGIWLLRWSVTRDMNRAAQKAADAEAEAGKVKDVEEAEVEPSSKAAKMFAKFKKAATHGLDQDIHKSVETDQATNDMHAAAEVFNPETEQVFKYLQVFSACAVSFSHGANDVANAVGPFSGIWYVYRNWTVSATGDTPIWVMALGGAGIVVGLATYGYKIMATLGVGLVKMTPCRGFAAELATAFTISLASVYGMPVSSTQCITGGEMGVGLVENWRTGVNWKLFVKQVLAWVATLIVAGFLSAALFALGVYAPSLTMSKEIAVYEDTIRSLSEGLYKDLNKTNFALKSTFGAFDAKLNKTIYDKIAKFKAMFDTKKIGYIDPYTLVADLNVTLVTYKNYTVVATGFNPTTKTFIPGNKTDAILSNNKIQMYPNLWDDYMWLVIMGAIVSFIMAAGIGANDVANAFGTSVGAKTITLKQACLIASVFEFAGAVGLGGEVTKTIAGSIARPAAFQAVPELFAYGMFIALVAASSWVFFATYLSLAVSTTHSVIGAVLGFALIWGGKGAVVWNDKMDEFPFSKGLVPVVCSWFVSPIMAGTSAGIIFALNRSIVLRRENSTTWAIYSYPVLIMITVYVNVFFVMFKGAKSVAHWSSNQAAWAAACVAGGCFLLAIFPGTLVLRWAVKRDIEKAAQKAADIEAEAGKVKDAEDVEVEPSSKAAKMFASIKKAATRGLTQDIHKAVETDSATADMHAAAEVFNPETEQVYGYLQVFSACAVSFAHGANDVANAVGPFSGIWYVYRNWSISSSGDTPVWVMVLGGAGIVVGLATYGYNIMATLGVGLAKMTPSRGFSAELATSFTVSLASVYGLPISTTQCITGAEMGVGLAESWRTGVNWKLFGKQILAWVFTLIVSGFLSAGLFAAGVYAPSLTMSKDIAIYEDTIRSLSEGLYKDLNKTNFALKSTFGTFDAKLNKTIYDKLAKYKAMFNTKVIGYIDPYTLVDDLNVTLVTYKNYTVVATGFNPTTKTFIPGNTTDPLLSNNKVQVSPYDPELLKGV